VFKLVLELLGGRDDHEIIHKYNTGMDDEVTTFPLHEDSLLIVDRNISVALNPC
jgi:hypothetical protein